MPAVPATRRAKKLAIHLGDQASDQVSSMLERKNLNDLVQRQRDIPNGSIGYLGGGEAAIQGDACFFTGMPINGPDVSELVDAESASRLFPMYDGSFSAIFWDAYSEILVVATDCLGMQPLYMHRSDTGLTLVSETKAVQGVPDLAAWGAFISIGHPIGERSLVEGLQRVPPASILTYDCARRELHIHRYWSWPAPSDAWRNYDFVGSLEQEIRAYADFGDPGTLLLSGGWDSRLILFLLIRAGVPADALIVAHEDEHADEDGRLAAAIATYADMPFRKARPSADFYSSPAYLDYLIASDAGYPSLDLFIAKVASLITSSTVWEGLAPGFVFMPLRQSEGGFDAYLKQEIKSGDSAIWRAAKTLFKADVVEAMFNGFSEDLRDEMARLPRDSHGLARFVIENRSRNRPAMNPLKVFANKANVFTPGLSKDFMTHAATIPFQEKQHGRFYRSLFERLDKKALKIPVLSGAELMKGSRFSAIYHCERMRLKYHTYRRLYPSLFPGTRKSSAKRSAFLGSHLFEEDDQWLNPDASKHLQTVNRNNYLAWRLLFHWKAWQWVHEGRLQPMLGAHAQNGDNSG